MFKVAPKGKCRLGKVETAVGVPPIAFTIA